MEICANLPCTTVKSHFKALGLYSFKRGFGWAYKRGGLYPGGLINGGGGLYPGGLINGGLISRWAYKRGGLYPGGLISGIKRMFRNDEIKRI